VEVEDGKDVESMGKIRKLQISWKGYRCTARELVFALAVGSRFDECLGHGHDQYIWRPWRIYDVLLEPRSGARRARLLNRRLR